MGIKGLLDRLPLDYKICASAIVLRFKKVLTYLISDTQMGFMKGRFIGECTRLICDIIEKCDENKKRNAIAEAQIL
jgi:hypothetical protein